MSLLKDICPDLKNEWHPSKNEGLNFDGQHAKSNLKVWWICRKNPKHEWYARVRSRAVSGYGCPFCSGLKVLPDESFAALFPKLAAEFHPTRNLGLDPWKLGPRSNKRVWWRCNTAHKHEWQATVSSRVTYGSGCKRCGYIRVPLSKAAPEIAKEWHPTKNDGLTPNGISSGSPKKVWWQCQRNPTHEWQAQVRIRIRAKTRCPFCAKLAPQIEHEMLDLFNPKLAAQWHPTKNEEHLPSQFTPSSQFKAWWICPIDPTHTWKTSIRNRARLGHNCPFCAPRSGQVSPGHSLADRFPELAKEWHPTKNTLKPSGVTPGSSKRVWWQCRNDPSHVWDATVTVRTQPKSKGQCPFCSGFRVTPANSLQNCHPEIAKEWHPIKNAPLTPDKIKRASGKKVWWQCSKNPQHEWRAIVKNRTVLSSGCPHCENENKVTRLLEALLHPAESNTNYLQTFINDLRSLRSLAKQEAPKTLRLKQAFFRMLYSSAITVMETYLSDAFYQSVIKNESLIERLMLTTPEFRDKKYSLSEVVAWQKQTKEKVSEYLFNIVWHNLAKVRCMYNDVLGVKFPDKSDSIHVAIAIRHDVIHRNGRTISGKFHRFTDTDIQKLFNEIEVFVIEIDNRLKSSIANKISSAPKK
jgi:Probable Zinc-ribbon domain